MKRFSNILFVADPTTDNAAAFGRAVELAKNNQAELTVAGIVETSEKHKTMLDHETEKLLQAMVDERREELELLLRNASSNGAAIEAKVLVGKGFLEVIREVLRHERDLVIKNAESLHGIAHLFGSTDMKLLRKCPCPVWVIKSARQHEKRQILVALDHDAEDAQVDSLNAQLLQMATSLALAESAELHAVHAWLLPHEDFLRSARSHLSVEDVDKAVDEEEQNRRRWLETLIDKHCGAGGQEAVDYLKPQLHLVKGSPDHLVPDLAEQLGVEVIVMGTLGRTGIPGFFVGNTAENILHQVDCSVLAIKPPGFVSPVAMAD